VIEGGESGEPQAKATNFNSMALSLRKMLDADSFARVVASLSPATRQMVETPKLPMSWIPTRAFMELLDAAGRIGFAGDEARVEEMARRAVGGDMRTVYKMFIRMFSPQFVMERAAKLWGTYTRNNGTMRAVAAGERAADVHYNGLSPVVANPTYWAFQRGAVRAVGEATGIKNVRVETVSGGGRSGDCVLRVSWS
jgi:hypothetical protein